MNIKKYNLFVLALGLSLSMSAQSLTQAKKWFENGEFEKAKPVFKKLVRQSPSNASYNFWYGACCYETNATEEAQPYLEKSAKRNYINAFRYLGKVYKDMYRYDDAIANYEEHIEWLEKKRRDTAEAEAELEELRVAARMIKGVEDITVIDSFVVSKQDFLRTYKISRQAGSLHRHEGIAGTVFQSEMGNKIIYGDLKNDSTYQLYSRIKLINNWSAPTPIKELNELGNVNYPFLMADGVTLYFASDNEGLGGYDIFVTRFDSEDGTYLRPSNVGMPFNSPANDYLYVIDEMSNLGWFASDRYQPADSVCVYVFEPNPSKHVYNYEEMDPQKMIEVATLKKIRSTWKDEAVVQAAKTRLYALQHADDENHTRKEFEFVINDRYEYTSLKQFKSATARKLFQQFTQKEKDLASLNKELASKRMAYQNAAENKRSGLAPAILELEERVCQLRTEVDALVVKVQNEEIKALK